MRSRFGALHLRIAAALDWELWEVESLSLASLRELVRPLSPKLAHEIDLAIRGKV